jgi:hypothetical protein
MVKVPVTSGNSVALQPLDRAPLRYAETRNLAGPALQQFGNAIGQAAEDLDQIEAAKDQAYALDGDNLAAAKAADLAGNFRNLHGDEPDRVLPQTLQEFDDLQTDLLAKARSQRARAILKRTLTVRRVNLQSQLAAHATDEMFKFRDGGLVAGIGQAATDAVNSAGTEQFAVAIGTGLTRIEERARLNGTAPEAVQLAKSDFLDQVHGGVLDTMFAAPDPDVDGITAYLNSFGGQMTPKLRNGAFARLQRPLQDRVARSDVDNAMGFAASADGGAPAPGTAVLKGPQGEVSSELVKAGYSSAVVAGFLGNFEVEGGYDGARGDGGSASGIAQWRNERRANFRRRFGKDPHEASAAEQARFVVWEMQNPREAGMTVAQRDAILRAPDAETAAELIDQHYERSSGAHRAQRKAAAGRFGGSGYASAPREWDRAQIYANLEAAAEREAWNPERLERARAMADERIDRDEGLLKEQRQEANDQAAATVESLGDGFKSVSQIPRDVWNRLSPEDKMQWEHTAEANRKPVEPAANGDDAITLNLMSYYEPERFKSLNLQQYRGRITRAELESYLVKQANMRTARPDDPKDPKISSGITSALSYGTRLNQLELDSKQESAVLQIMETDARARVAANGGKPLSDAEYQEIFRSATRKVKTTTSFLGIPTGTSEVPRYNLTLSNMSDSTRQRLVTRFRRSMGREPTDDELLRLYRVSPLR